MKNMKRSIFFWMERLQITRSERVVISSLIIIVVLLWSLSLFLKNEQSYRGEYYEEIKTEFQHKSAALKVKKQNELKKYSPSTEIQDQNEQVQNMDATKIVNINTANIDELQLLKGIGETYAQRIIDYRQKNGEFNSPDDLLKIKGIGTKRLADIKPFITVE